MTFTLQSYQCDTILGILIIQAPKRISGLDVFFIHGKHNGNHYACRLNAPAHRYAGKQMYITYSGLDGLDASHVLWQLLWFFAALLLLRRR